MRNNEYAHLLAYWPGLFGVLVGVVTEKIVNCFPKSSFSLSPYMFCAGIVGKKVVIFFPK